MSLIKEAHMKVPNLSSATSERARKGLFTAMGFLWISAVTWAMVNGPRMLAEAERQIADEIESESRDVCRRLRMPPGSSAYSACASELNLVRRLHERRIVEAQSFI
jgi:hypothetical protein